MNIFYFSSQDRKRSELMEKRNKDIEMNMLRERAKKLPEVTESMFEECNSHNVQLVKQYLETSNHLSPETLKQYKSGMYQFVYWLKENAMDKPFYKVKKMDFKRYMSYLISRGMSSNGLKFKKSAVSAFCAKFLEIFIVDDEDYEEYKTFRNFTTGTIEIPKNQVYNKIPISKKEYDLLIETLTDDENWMGVAWVSTMFFCGARRREILQFKSEIVNYDPKGKKYILTHNVKGKGRAGGKDNVYMIPLEAINHIKKWLDTRGYEHEYIFTTRWGKDIKVLSLNWANNFCEDVLSDILGRRINVHLFKGSAVTYSLEQGKSMKVVSKYIGHHESCSTTESFYDLRSYDDEMDELFDDELNEDLTYEQDGDTDGKE